MKGTTLVGVVLLATLLALVLDVTLGVFLLAALLVGGLLYFRRERCGFCGARGQISQTGSEVVSREKAYGIVTRTDTITKKKTLPDRTAAPEVTRVNRQERVPTVRITTRAHYQCANCKNIWTKDIVTEAEDFSREEPQPQKETVVIQREVVKVPCKYCGMLVDLLRDSKCPSCGANLTLGKQ